MAKGAACRPLDMLLVGVTAAALMFAAVVVADLSAGRLWLVVTADSMSPALRPGDLIVVDPFRGPVRGDVVTVVRDDGRLVTHRMVAVSDGMLTLRGDANGADDRAVPTSQTVGVVVRRVRWVGWPHVHLRAGIAWQPLAVVAAAAAGVVAVGLVRSR